MSTFRQKLSTGSSSSSSSGSSSSCSDSESASSHSSTQSDESHHVEENKLQTQINNHLPSFSDTSDEEEPPKRRKLPESRLATHNAQVSTGARPSSVTSTHSKHNTSPAPSLASTSTRRNGYTRTPSTSTSTSRPAANLPTSSTYARPPSTNNVMSIFTASRASSSLSIKSPELSGGSSESKSSSSSSENDSPSTTNYSQIFGNVSSTQQNFSQINGKKTSRKTAAKKGRSEVATRAEKERETPAIAMERMVIDEEMLNEIKIEIKSEDEEFEQNKTEVKDVTIATAISREEKSRTNETTKKANRNAKNNTKRQERKECLKSSSSKSGSSSSSSSSENESSGDARVLNNNKRVAKPTTSANANRTANKQRKTSQEKQNEEKKQSQPTTTLHGEKQKNNNNIDALFDELKKTSPGQSKSQTADANDTYDTHQPVQHKKPAKNSKSSPSITNEKSQTNGTRKRARPPESSEKSEYTSDSDDSDLAPLMTRADAEVATKVFGKRLSTQQSTENGPCLRATRSMRATTTRKVVNGNKDTDESGSESSQSSDCTDCSSASGTASATKSSSATGSDSGSASVSPSGSESESSSHSSCSSCHSAGSSSLPEVRKAVRGKRVQNSNSSSIAQDETPRKLTRSRRRLEQRVDTDSDSDQAINGSERLLNGERQVNGSAAGIAKRALGLNGKSRGFLNSLLRESPPICISPPCVQEKMCPIEGCDSKGHLGGSRDRHFLPEACPLYHNMTSDECVQMLIERRKHAENFPMPIKADADDEEDCYGAKRVRTTAQKELWDRIHKSWRDFEENPPQPKPQPECEEGNEQREQDLTGMAPEYDLQLFRAAQAIAAEAIEDEVADCPVGKGIKYIIMGKYKMKVWYQSPYPDDAARLPKMYICEYCLRYQKSEVAIKRHALKCVWRHPPGDEIYRKGKLQVWQVDGKTQKQYCQHLCLLAKFFLDHKTLYYDVEPFLFYIMTLADIDGCHIVGYFSKEKNSFYNVSCILTLPPYQRKGYGRLLIDFSYLLTRVEGKIGSPEKPLSDLGLISYRSYWKDVLLEYLINRSGNTVSIKDISKEMAIYSYDIVSTLQALGMMKYWKGKHIILKKQDVIDDYLERVSRRGKFPKIDETCLRWSPFVPPDSDNPNL